jgi:predicted  nucleic acid-binding Zn ribbon protein
MHQLNLEFQPPPAIRKAKVAELVSNFVSALRMNGQVCGREWPTYYRGSNFFASVLVPEKSSLSKKFAGEYVSNTAASLETIGIKTVIHYVAKDSEGGPICKCAKSSAFVLYTHYLSLEPPIRCFDCLGAKPLYRLAKMPQGEFYRVVCWQSDYQSCDALQMNCATLERASIRELSQFKSRLSTRGIDLCKELSALNKVTFYYYLYHGEGRDEVRERARVCPSCSSAWYKKRESRGMFEFKCSRCKLLSNWARNVPKPV